jgi:hypothetical protein
LFSVKAIQKGLRKCLGQFVVIALVEILHVGHCSREIVHCCLSGTYKVLLQVVASANIVGEKSQSSNALSSVFMDGWMDGWSKICIALSTSLAAQNPMHTHVERFRRICDFSVKRSVPSNFQ